MPDLDILFLAPAAPLTAFLVWRAARRALGLLPAPVQRSLPRRGLGAPAGRL